MSALTLQKKLQELIVATSKPSWERSHHDLQLIRGVVAEQAFMKEMHEEAVATGHVADHAHRLSRLASAIQFASFAPGEHLMIQGDEGDYWFLLLSGSVDVSIEGLGVVKTLGAGSAFGEAALLSSATRGATITACEEVQTLRLHQADFSLIMRGAHEARLATVVSFLSSLSLFKDWSPTRLKLLAGRMGVRQAHPGEHIVQQGDPVGTLVLVRSGVLNLVHSGGITRTNRWPAQKGDVERLSANPFLSPVSTNTGDKPSSAPQNEIKSDDFSPSRLEDGLDITEKLEDSDETKEDDYDSPRKPTVTINENVNTHSFPTSNNSTTVDTIVSNGRFPMRVRTTTLPIEEVIGELQPGSVYGMPLLARGDAHPVSLVASSKSGLVTVMLLPVSLLYSPHAHVEGLAGVQRDWTTVSTGADTIGAAAAAFNATWGPQDGSGAAGMGIDATLRKANMTTTGKLRDTAKKRPALGPIIDGLPLSPTHRLGEKEIHQLSRRLDTHAGIRINPKALLKIKGLPDPPALAIQAAVAALNTSLASTISHTSTRSVVGRGVGSSNLSNSQSKTKRSGHLLGAPGTADGSRTMMPAANWANSTEELAMQVDELLASRAGILVGMQALPAATIERIVRGLSASVMLAATHSHKNEK